MHFLIDCPNYKKLRDSTLTSTQDTEHIDLRPENVTKKLTVLKWIAWIAIYTLGKFAQAAMESRETSRKAFLNLTLKKNIITPYKFYLFWFILIF